MGNIGQLQIGGVLEDHCDIVLKALFKPASEGFATEAKIPAPLDSLVQWREISLLSFHE